MHTNLIADDPESMAPFRLYPRGDGYSGWILNQKERDELNNWCEQFCVGSYSVGLAFIDFELAEDYVHAYLIHYVSI
jgi:hypothetical protein